MPDQTSRDMMIYDTAIVPRGIHGRPPGLQTPANFWPLLRAAKEAAERGRPLCDEPDDRGRKLYLMDMEVHPRRKAAFFVWTLAAPNAAAQMYPHRGQARLSDEDIHGRQTDCTIVALNRLGIEPGESRHISTGASDVW